MNFAQLYERLRLSPMKEDEFFDHLSGSIDGICIEKDTGFELLKAYGFRVARQEERIVLDTTKTQWQEETFCFVDIETTGSRPESGAIIEVGALKYRDGKIIDKFESLVFTKEVPEKITELTGISTDDLKNSPNTREVLAKFREFLGNSVFVAHNVNFDYSFISCHMDKIGLGNLLNPRLCTIDLARRSILSPRYSLAFLNSFLGINIPVSHRGYADALSAMRVFEICLLSLPQRVLSTQDLIDFSRGRLKK